MTRLLALIPYIPQILLIIHCIKNRNLQFLWLLVVLPYVGGIVYFILVILPELKDSRAIGRTGDAIASAINSSRKTKELEKLVQIQDTVSNNILLADAYCEEGKYKEAIVLYDKCLSGPYQNDETIEFKRLKAIHYSGDSQGAKALLAEYKKKYSIDNEEKKLLELLINEDYDTLNDIFENSANFEVGYVLSRHYHDAEDYKSIEKIVDSMKKFRRDYPLLKKGRSKALYASTKKLLKK